MDDTPTPIVTSKQFTAAMLESARLHTDDRWALARTRSGEQPTWLAGFDADQPVWVLKSDEAAIYDHAGVEDARARCTALPDLDDVLYAVCHLKNDDRERLNLPLDNAFMVGMTPSSRGRSEQNG